MNKFKTYEYDSDYIKAPNIYGFTVKNINGEEVKLNAYRGHVCIIVNVSSKCGFAANHYAQFNELMLKYGDSKKLRILAFPCWQFSGEEDNTFDDTVKFDVFEKIDVNGEYACPLWKFLKLKQGSSKGSFIKWNFTKFIIDKYGEPVERFECKDEPLKLVERLRQYW